MIDINKLTIDEIKELQGLLGGILGKTNVSKESSIFNDVIGKYVVIRSRNEGINVGYVKALDDTGIIITKARRLYYHKPLDLKMSWYEGVASSGCSDDTRMSNEVEEKYIIEDYSITLCTKEAEDVLRNAKTNKQN